MSSPEYPALAYADWEPTRDTLHMWTQIVGKTRMALAPPQNHWWHVTLYVTPAGLTTSTISLGRDSFEVEFDFLTHNLAIRSSNGGRHSIPLYPRSVADFYAEYLACLRSLAIDVEIRPVPVEFDDTTPFDRDRHHASYDKGAVERFHRILLSVDNALKKFRSGFIGKSSPVHFFWGSFDLAVTRFCGRLAPERKGVDPMTAEAYSHEVISCGFWPGDRRYKQPAFYGYTAPAPVGLDGQSVRPQAARWDAKFGEFLINYDDVRSTRSPEATLLDFCQSTYEAGANLAQWDRAALERPVASGVGRPGVKLGG